MRAERREWHHEMRFRRWGWGWAPGREHPRDRWRSLPRGTRLFRRSLTVLPVLALLALAGPVPALRPAVRRRMRERAAAQRALLAEEFGAQFAPVPRVPARVAAPTDRLDLRWLVCAPLLGLMAAAPAALVAWVLVSLLVWPRAYSTTSPLVLLAEGVFAVSSAPGVLGMYGRWSAALLAPPASDRLEQRVQRLTETRADAVDAQAAELRRIERDLHDGVQARLVAMGLNLGAVEQLMERDPQAARALLVQSREASATALQELRGLVRGIHPPVLAERGLADAVRALALDCPLKAEVSEDLLGRAEAPVESAVYFAVSELLTNAVRHAQAERVWIDLHHTGDRLRVQVTDDGRGGADPAAEGSGLRGIERRLGTFDGVLALSSPLGGPTIATLELPCVLSSPRTSTSCAKG